MLQPAQCQEITDSHIRLFLNQTYTFFIQKLNEPHYKQVLDTVSETVFGKIKTIQIINQSKQSKQSKPMSVNEIVELFDGKIV